MKYVGIDIGKTYHYSSILDEENNKTEPLRFSCLTDGYNAFLASLAKQDCRKDETIIGLEATGHLGYTKNEGHGHHRLSPRYPTV